MKPINTLFFLTSMALLLLASCDAGSGTGHSPLSQGDTIPMRYATNITMVDYGDYLKADFRNPWDTTRTLQTFLLVPRDAELPESLPKGTVIRTPLQRAIVYTSTHNSLVQELGAADAIIGICDTQYIRNAALRTRIDSGLIADCGTNMAPNIEKILMLRPEAILLSAFENSNDHNKVGQLGIPIIDCTDYMEASPLARAEWMKLYGRLFGKGAEADSLFSATERAYLDIKRHVAENTTTKPMVLSETIYGQSWSVPCALSTSGALIADAGGKNPFDTYNKAGSAQLAPEEVLFRAGDADVWMLKYSQDTPPTIAQMGKDTPIYTKFRAYRNGEIYGCDANNSSFFEDLAFHPHWVLAEYANIIHPELPEIPGNHHYYNKLLP